MPGTQVGRLYITRSSDIDAYIAKHPTNDNVTFKDGEDEVDALAEELGLQPNVKGGK